MKATFEVLRTLSTDKVVSDYDQRNALAIVVRRNKYEENQFGKKVRVAIIQLAE
jgi:hypothetical protein